MTSPFKSTIGVASRRKSRSVVERSVFVLAGVGEHRVAFPVELVERVLRQLPSRDAEQPTGDSGGSDTVRFGNDTLPMSDLAAVLHRASSPSPEAAVPYTASSTARVLVVRDAAAPLQLTAWRVHAVYDVVAIETALLRTAASADVPGPDHASVRGMFTRDDVPVWVLDPARLGRIA